MNRTSFLSLTAVALALSFALTGCHPRPQNPETIYGRRGARVGDIEANPILWPDAPAGTNFMEIPPNVREGHQGWNRNESVFAGSTVYFDYDSSALKAAERSKVVTVADHLKGNPATAVEVQGHADERGTEEYNRSLGERRALALREELVRLGIDQTRVDTITYGEDRPVDPGHNEEAWRKNRRGEFILLTPPTVQP